MPRRVTKQRTSPRRRSRLWLLGVAGLCLVGYLYYRPVKAYISTSRTLSARQAEVRELTRQKAALERRLTVSGTGDALLEEARRLGYVRPGERLFIVRGVEGWVKAHRRNPAQ
jgi:cell division protein FtsB